MDWYVDSSDVERVSDLRREFAAYIKRHGAPGEDVAGAELAFSELITNAAQHATGPMWVSVDWTALTPIVSVYDLGPSFVLDPEAIPTAAGGRGLAIAASLAESLAIEARESGGSRVEARLDIERANPISHDPPRQSIGVLPALDEAGPIGFQRESFLRALVVQLAQSVEAVHGPALAEELVAQVGIDVGSQMETEYRLAKNLDISPLTPEQLSDCFVRLKHAIDGDFYPLEITPERIVLANRKCPFGPAVQKAPALCRMTSSVFGGIAARNVGEATVLLEERIAVGDHQCKVVVHLTPVDDDEPGHRYRAPSAGD